MKAARSIRKISNARGRRDDGANTRAQILQAAGEVFAEKGLDRTTGKEIADRAGTNSAAVNYYFGGVAGLYEEVLVEAHRRFVSYEALTTIATREGTAEEKLRSFIELVVTTLTGPASSSWAFRVLSREILSPSPFIEALRMRELQPKKLLISAIVGEIMDLPADHPAVASGCFSVVMPCAMLLVADRHLLTQLFPILGGGPGNTESLVDHLVRFSLAGLVAVAEPYRQRAPK
ncbi:TetR/AcrR family transcriptional regulator [Microvirga brassicacearum]|uniref:DUF1956 domain-containing protein n=1 Tax=Microvirga brassicacearum TaxID=2580413 RepID=A0A5N3P9U2_9HYPH|nr:CerR family C-terminal domain-containing protein [Microvirga brassicacearum]KAB0266395.1 DUF1956 domain-containing protein [Microvirga brassicacearum]